MLKLRNLTIRSKLTAMMMAISLVVTVVLSVSFVAYQFQEHRQQLVRNVASQAEMVARNCEAALSFDIPEDAEKVLKALDAVPSIVFACIYDAQGRVFATHVRPGSRNRFRPPPAQPGGHSFGKRYLRLFHPVELQGVRVGTVLLQADMSNVAAAMTALGVNLTATIGVCLLVALLFSSGLQALISRPILSLAALAAEISDQKDYSIRASRQSGDELGRLIDSFNEMLSQIQSRDKALQRSEELLKDAQNIAHIGSWETDLTTNTIFWSDELFRLLGYAPGEVRPSLPLYFSHIHPEDQDQVRRKTYDLPVSAKEEGPPRPEFNFSGMTYRLIARDGTVRDVYARNRVETGPSGSALRIHGTVQDISERMQSERERARLTAAVDQARESIMLINGQGLVEYVNPAAEQILGRSRGSLIGRDVLSFGDTREQHELNRQIWETLKRGEIWSGRNAVSREGAPPCVLEINISPIRESTGRVGSFVSIGRDITREVELQEQLRQSQKMEAIGTLAGGIAHDFNNILTVILGYSELAHEDAPPGSALRQNLKHVIDSSRRARDLVKQILAFSRKSIYERKHLLLGPLVRETAKLLRATIPATIEIKLDAEARAGPVLADPTQIHQVLMNLCTNAAQAMQDSGGTLEVSVGELAVGAGDDDAYPGMAPGRYVELTVRDTGPGIEPEIMDRIFDPFFTTKGVGRGTGMGLAVVHGIVQSHGGLVNVQSSRGQGAAFHLILPREDGAAEPAAETDEETPAGSGRILLVDDEQNLAEMGRAMLSRLGYEVSVETRPLEALEIFKARPDEFDLVITDKTMPKMTGFDLVREIKLIRNDIPIIMCTGYTDGFDEKNIDAMGIRELIMKPFDKREIAAKVGRVLGIQRTE